MAKYIKTKNRIYKVENEYIDLGIRKGYIIGETALIKSEQVVLQGENLSDLVDGYWWENKNYSDPIFIPNFGLVENRMKAWIKSDNILESNAFDDITIYGSMYVKGKGWIHMTKVSVDIDGKIKEVLING